MNSDLKIIETGVNIEYYCADFRISRHFFKWNNSNKCLVRAYCYPTENIVIISQIEGQVINTKEQIIAIFQKIQLKAKKTTLITHIENKFYKSLVGFNLQHLDNVKKEISLQIVEELIGRELEPVETWLEIDIEIYQKNELRRQEKNHKLLQFYLEPDLEFFTSKFEKIEYELEQIEYEYRRYRQSTIPVRGALFYYPDVKLENQQKHICFLNQKDLEDSHKYSDRSALEYVNNYDVRTEIVICVQVDEHESVCGIFPRINSLVSDKTESNC